MNFSRRNRSTVGKYVSYKKVALFWSLILKFMLFFMGLEIFSYSIGDFVSGLNWKLQVSSLLKLRILRKCSSFVAYCWDFFCHFGTGLHLQSLAFLYSYFVVQHFKWPLRKRLPLCHSPADPRQTDLSLLVMTCFPTNLHKIMKMSVAFFSSFIKRIQSILCLKKLLSVFSTNSTVCQYNTATKKQTEFQSLFDS